MYLQLTEQCFNDDYGPELSTILLSGMNKRADVTYEKIAEPSKANWLKTLNQRDQLKWQNVFDRAAQKKARFKPNRVVVVKPVEKSDWSQNKPVVSLTDAVNLATMAVKIVLENANADRNFLLCICDEPLRTQLINFEKNLFLEYASPGGINEVLKAVKGKYANDGIWRYKACVMFDSDAPCVNQPSSTATSLIAACQTAQLTYHCLKRRAIENYLPLKSARALLTERLENKDLKLVDNLLIAWAKLTADQQHYLHMKMAFKDPSCNASLLYEALDAQTRKDITRALTDLKKRITLSEVYQAKSGDPMAANQYEAVHQLMAKEGSLNEFKPFLSELKQFIGIY